MSNNGELGNGILKIGSVGTRKCQIGENGKIFQVDVIAVLNNWSPIDAQYRDADGKVIPEKLKDWNEELHNFVMNLVAEASGQPAPMTLTMTRAFMANMQRDGAQLRHFFDVASVTAPS